ncbi:MAG: BppU family phage baseplate upper protein, partial [Lachnospiraceae bacterium]|nr:BppU family phage baseplate upper protein [Lachnospiraceae bacterium]
MKILTPIKIDLIDPHPLPIMKVQQGNIGRGALVTLTANGAIAALTDETVRTYVKKPDGTKVYAAGRVTADGKAQIEFTNQMLAVPGRVELELELINDTDYITTPIAILEVGRSNIDGAAIESSNEFSAFVTALAQIGPAAAGKLGTVKPDGTTITADTDGTIHAADQDVSGKAVAFAAATSRTNLATGDTVATGF